MNINNRFKCFLGAGLIAFNVVISTSGMAAELWEEPQDTSQAMFNPDLYAWKLFVALNWPANISQRKADPNKSFGENTTTVWESWKLSSGPNDEVFLKEGKDPGKWLGGSTRPEFRDVNDFEKLPLQQFLGSSNLIHVMADKGTSPEQNNENHLNQAAYEFITTNDLYYIEGQEKFFVNAVSLENDARNKFEKEGKLQQPFEYRKKLIDFPPASKEVKAQWRLIEEKDKERYRWAEFIQDGKKVLYGLTALHITTKDLPNWLWATFEHIDNPKREGAEPWILPTNDSSAGPNGYPDMLGIKGTRWENYRLRGAQINFVDSTGKPTLLANSQIEKGFQTSSSCITCHSLATIGPKIGIKANRLAFFKEQIPNAGELLPKGKRDVLRVGSIGSPEPAMFEQKAVGSEVIGELKYLQTDFVWSLGRAKRQNPK